MPRRSKGARLYLRERAGREPIWVIRDGESEVGTDCGYGDRARAEGKLAQYIAAKQVRPGERHPSEIPLADILTAYARDVGPSHAAPELVHYHFKHLVPFFGPRMVTEVRAALCADYVRHRTQQMAHPDRRGRKELSPAAQARQPRVSAATARRELITLRAAINAWHAQHPLPALPVVTLPPEAPPRQRFLTRSEAAALLWAARRLKQPHVARMILIGLYTGTRHAALLALGWAAQEHGGWVDVEAGIMYRRGLAEAETSKRRSPCRIPVRLLHHLRRWHRMDMALKRPPDTVISWRGRVILKERKAWAMVREEARLGSDVTPHVLRHTCASWALAEGLSIWDVAALLGASVDIIDATYGHHHHSFQPAISGAFLGRAGGMRKLRA